MRLSTARSAGRVNFGSAPMGTHVTRVRVNELVPERHVSWKTTSSFRPESEGTAITFDLRDEGGSTAIARRGFFSRPTTSTRCVRPVWGYYLVSLKQYLEIGEVAPGPDFARVLK